MLTRFTTLAELEEIASFHGLAGAMLVCESIDQLRSLAPLPKDAQELLDAQVIQVGLERLTLVKDLLSRGLRYPVTDPLSVMEVYWEKVSRSGGAHRTMLPDARGERQLADRSGQRIPLFATFDDFSFHVRTLRASERAGAPLDTSGAAASTRTVNEAVEDQAINGAGISIDGNAAPGILTESNVNSTVYLDSEAWTAAGHSGEDIIVDLLAMIDALQADKKYGPYGLYLPTTYGVEIAKDFKSATSGTTRERIESIEEIEAIRVADMLPTDRVAMIQLTSDVIDVVDGQQPTLISWSDGPGMNFSFMILAFQVVRVKSDYDGNSGIVVGDTS